MSNLLLAFLSKLADVSVFILNKDPTKFDTLLRIRAPEERFLFNVMYRALHPAIHTIFKTTSESTHLPSTLMIKETDSAPRTPPIANMDTVMDQRRVAVSAPIGSPYLSIHVLLLNSLMYCDR